MKRTSAKKLLPIIKAFSEGKQIQFFGGTIWEDRNTLSFDSDPSRYRIKPEPKYRSFKSVEECWAEMQKHQPFGWIMDRDKNYTSISSMNNRRDFSYMFNNFIFADGLPFGIKEE